VLAFRDGLRRADFELMPLPSAPATATRPWEAAVYLETNERGEVHRVLLEEPTEDPALNRAIVRSLYGWRSEKAATRPLRGRVVLRYLPPSSEPGAAP
jgi:hypothetical protein